nr:MAG TPA: hypothetical protein [Caudoviricetes sp.]
MRLVLLSLFYRLIHLLNNPILFMGHLRDLRKSTQSLADYRSLT